MTLASAQHVLMLQRFGGPEGFAVVEQPMPEPGAGQVLVKVLAASVQFTDVILRKGRYPDLKEKPPLVLGYDVVGEVVKLGPGVTSPLVGQRVADLTMSGSYSQYRTLAADRVTVVGPGLDAAEVSSMILSWTIAYQLLHRDAHVRRGQKLLVIGAAGAVGQALVVLGRLAGCEVWGATRARHAELVRALGATPVDSDHADFANVLPGRFDVVLDGIGERGFTRAWRAVGPRGRLTAYGFSAGVKRNASILRLGLWFAKLWWWNTFSGARSTSFVSIMALRAKHPDWFVADLGALLGMLARREIEPRVAERIGFDAVADAHERLERGDLEGKIVLVPNPADVAVASAPTNRVVGLTAPLAPAAPMNAALSRAHR
jgi:NADPH:quinone reductase-like Zn-dependent oxidoreductase